MDAIILGAGRPYRGKSPAALTQLTRATRALDWQIATFRALSREARITFVGGYGLEQVAPLYPDIHHVAAPDWDSSGALRSLLRAPLEPAETFVTYADTVFHKSALDLARGPDADVVFGYDSEWQQRYPNRRAEDIALAELVDVAGDDAEFTGLLRLNAKASAYLQTYPRSDARDSLLDLIRHFREAGFSVEGVDLAHQWAEFNDTRDIAEFVLGTKADTLARLQGRLRKSSIEPQVSFTVDDWRRREDHWLSAIVDGFSGQLIIVRSSSSREDDWLSSGAGQFLSKAGIAGGDRAAVRAAINDVIASYGEGVSATHDQILVQAQVEDVACAGVILTCGLETGAPYYKINIESSGSTDIVTAGRDGCIRTISIARNHEDRLPQIAPELISLVDAVGEIERLIAWERLDIEFAVGEDGRIHIFQVRPLVVGDSPPPNDLEQFEAQVDANIAQFRQLQAPPHGVAGDRTVFGVMPDWNPAEIIGTRPRPLAYDLYRHLVTDHVWARQRAEFGFRDLTGQPLMVAFSGQPYVDVRASLNSFVPAAMSDDAARRLVDAQIAVLEEDPSRHDKIEFEVAFTVWDAELASSARERYARHGVSDEDIAQLERGLREITRDALTRLDRDIAPIERLKRAHAEIDLAELPAGRRAIELLDACRQWGTPAFAHAARAGFIAVTLLGRMVETGSLKPERLQAFWKSLRTVNRQLQEDRARGLDLDQLVARYGHLRPGTYEIGNQAYWEDPRRFLSDRSAGTSFESHEFAFSDVEIAWCRNFLDQLGLQIDVGAMTRYLTQAIEARELVKFDFTRTLSRALDLLVVEAQGRGIDRDALSFLGYDAVRQLVYGSLTSSDALDIANLNRARYASRQLVELPPLITSETDFHGYEQTASEPNFVTLERVVAMVVDAGDPAAQFEGNVVLAEQADPGYDWLFGKNIGGLITRYGGGNSHMAIRAAELGIPAAIGVGEMLYTRISAMDMIELDGRQRTIREVL